MGGKRDIQNHRDGPAPRGRWPRRGLEHRRWRWGAFAFGWAVLGLLLVSPSYIQIVSDAQPIPWSKVTSDLLAWYIWGLFVPPLWWLVRRFPVRRRNWRRNVGVLVLVGVAVSAIFCFLSLIKNALVTWAFGGAFSLSTLGSFSDYWLGGIEFYLAVYFAITAVLQAIAYYEKYRERELITSRLETQLALSHLELLRTQLHPHFLFNTLNAISALMHKDVEAADRMIVLLSDLLRLSLDKDERHQVPLQNELEYLQRYLEIEKIRFRDRLRVEIDVEPECLDVQVPKLILQPLVENSIRHGIAVRSAAGRVSIRARRQDDRLALEIADDGPGLSPNVVELHEGVGLSNTRARLEQLYGPDHRLELANAETGGLEVRLDIPFEETARFPMSGAA